MPVDPFTTEDHAKQLPQWRRKAEQRAARASGSKATLFATQVVPSQAEDADVTPTFTAQ